VAARGESEGGGGAADADHSAAGAGTREIEKPASPDVMNKKGSKCAATPNHPNSV